MEVAFPLNLYYVEKGKSDRATTDKQSDSGSRWQKTRHTFPHILFTCLLPFKLAHLLQQTELGISLE